jgi:hypothetical protein
MKSNAFVLSALALLVVVADLAGQVIKVAGAGEGYASEK